MGMPMGGGGMGGMMPGMMRPPMPQQMQGVACSPHHGQHGMQPQQQMPQQMQMPRLAHPQQPQQMQMSPPVAAAQVQGNSTPSAAGSLSAQRSTD